MFVIGFMSPPMPRRSRRESAVESNPSRPLRDVKQSTELPVVQIVPVTAADDLAIDAREAGDARGPCRRARAPRPRATPRPGSPSVERVEAGTAGDPQRLVARDRRHPGLRPVGRLTAVLASPRPNRGLLRRVLGGSRIEPSTPCASRRHCARTRPQSQSATDHLVERCNELNAQEGLPSMTLTLESDSAAAYAVLAPAYDLLTAEYAYGPWLAAIEWLARRATGSPAGACSTSAAAPARASCRCWTAASTSPPATSRRRWWPRRGAKAGGRADVLVADMRRLPVLGEFDLITCIDDAINHLLGPDEVADTLARPAREPRARRAARVRRQHARRLPRRPRRRGRGRRAAAALARRAGRARRSPGARPRSSSTSSPTWATGCGGAH